MSTVLGRKHAKADIFYLAHDVFLFEMCFCVHVEAEQGSNRWVQACQAAPCAFKVARCFSESSTCSARLPFCHVYFVTLRILCSFFTDCDMDNLTLLAWPNRADSRFSWSTQGLAQGSKREQRFLLGSSSDIFKATGTSGAI